MKSVEPSWVKWKSACELLPIIHNESHMENKPLYSQFHSVWVKYNLTYVTSLFMAFVKHAVELPQKLD